MLSGTAGPTNDPTVVLGLGYGSVSSASSAQSAPVDKTLGGQIALSEKEIIEQTLFKNSFSRTKSAKALGISRVTLYNKMKKYGMLKG